MIAEEFIELNPTVFHMASRTASPSIQRFDLLPTER